MKSWFDEGWYQCTCDKCALESKSPHSSTMETSPLYTLAKSEIKPSICSACIYSKIRILGVIHQLISHTSVGQSLLSTFSRLYQLVYKRKSFPSYSSSKGLPCINVVMKILTKSTPQWRGVKSHSCSRNQVADRLSNDKFQTCSLPVSYCSTTNENIIV